MSQVLGVEKNASIEKDVYQALSLRGSLNARDILGGTAPEHEKHRHCKPPLFSH